jgi:LysM repeat protein
MYQVKRGDTLTSIAKFFGVSTAVLATANHLNNGDRLTEGQALTIPPLPPAQLSVDPPIAPSGQPFTFNLTGGKAGEAITFEVDKPGGGKFTGQPHAASPDGVVRATYQSSGDDPGTYTVVATGDRGTSVRATFTVG